MALGRAQSDEALLRVLQSGAYSDLTIKCGSFEAKVHKVIVCTRSAYFAAACKPGGFAEGQTGTVVLKAARDDNDIGADDPEAVKLMIDFLYKHDYTATRVVVTEDEAHITAYAKESQTAGSFFPAFHGLSGSQWPSKHNDKVTPTGDCNTVMHAKMYALGSKYGIHSLQDAALGKFMKAATYAWNSEAFVVALRLVYTTTPENDKGLRNVATQTLLRHEDVLLRKGSMEKCMRSIDGLAYDLLKAKQTMKPDTNGPCCNTCGTANVKLCCNCHEQSVSCNCDPAPPVGPFRFDGVSRWWCRRCRPSFGL
ncbi:hypothetical protein BAUCODRAFT_158650 [Baudoinia panamericana UAMH 10762]|uniref:BTB domain-containing protein n=1 Tax=Baudoinia panamericana (strain UAMH 10762) TaxID=717646 RepID=M2LIM9_BAUPA|nr:uncharacterized protein BAUCODRAFT_158650 [Baudoinia panamericana UAMH 10762]EMC94017.1 hypothetical protein BAUCODRAFT_158650 [Baudoinia panamericana UAMH 10762]